MVGRSVQCHLLLDRNAEMAEALHGGTPLKPEPSCSLASPREYLRRSGVGFEVYADAIEYTIVVARAPPRSGSNGDRYDTPRSLQSQ